jgi:hypothetical protein
MQSTTIETHMKEWQSEMKKAKKIKAALDN